MSYVVFQGTPPVRQQNVLFNSTLLPRPMATRVHNSPQRSISVHQPQLEQQNVNKMAQQSNQVQAENEQLRLQVQNLKYKIKSLETQQPFTPSYQIDVYKEDQLRQQYYHALTTNSDLKFQFSKLQRELSLLQQENEIVMQGLRQF